MVVYHHPRIMYNGHRDLVRDHIPISNNGQIDIQRL